MAYIELNSLDEIKKRLGLEPDGKVQQFFTNTCAKHMDKYVPFDTGTLAETVWIDNHPSFGVDTDSITYEQEYAETVYYGIRNGKELNYQKDKHKLAGPYWDKRMVSAEMDKVVQEVQDYVNRGAR